jgi:transposase
MSQFELIAGASSGADVGAGRGAAKAAAGAETSGAETSGAETPGEVRLRRPERRQMELVPQCTDDLVSATHPVRTVAAVVAKLNLSAFGEPIKAREGVAGRDATDPELLVALWLYAGIRGIGSARELARRCQESAPFRWLCGGVGVNHRMLSDFRTDHGRGARPAVHAGDRDAGGSGTGDREPDEPGRRAGAREQEVFGARSGCKNCWRRASSRSSKCGGRWRSRRSCRAKR